MSEGPGSLANDGTTELWKQWYDANSRAWVGMLGTDKEAFMDPLGLYRRWFDTLENATRPAGGEAAASSPEVWQQWMEATANSWRKLFGIGTVLVELAPYWAEMSQEVWKQMFEGGRPPTDPLDFYQRWYNATNAPLSKMIREVLENESFLGDARRFMENYAVLEQTFQRTSEEYFDYLQLSTHADSARIAELVVGLDGKVDRLEEAFEEFEYGYAKPATDETVGAVEDRVKNLESKLDDHRSDLQRVEGKLDQLLSALNAPANNGPQEEIDATDAARRKARDLGVDLREVQGSGAEGRITVDDVRERGETE